MNDSSPLFLRVAVGIFGVLTLLCVWGAMRNGWSYARMRTVPVAVVNSSLFIDAPADSAGQPGDVEYTLRLDLITTDGSTRNIHWEDVPAKAAYPEEAFDELTRWAPGARHTIQQLRGEARALRLPDAGESPELNGLIGFSIAAAFFGFFAITILSVMATEDSLMARLPVRGYLGPWLVFFTVGAGVLVGDGFFVYHQLPKILFWPEVTATQQAADTAYEPASLPPHVQMTPAAREKMATWPHRVLTFQWNGATLHGGLGSNDGPYDDLAHEVCASMEAPCRFRISPSDRWDISAKAGWNKEFFLPLGAFLLFGAAFTSAGLFMRREKF